MFSIAFLCQIDLIYGCSCYPEYPLRSSYADAENIFIGKALQVQRYEHWNRKEIEFEIEATFKGYFSSSNKINVLTPLQEASCDLPIRVGQKWQVWIKLEYYYSFPDKENRHSQEKAFLSTNRCDLTTREIWRNIEFFN